MWRIVEVVRGLWHALVLAASAFLLWIAGSRCPACSRRIGWGAKRCRRCGVQIGWDGDVPVAVKTADGEPIWIRGDHP